MFYRQLSPGLVCSRGESERGFAMVTALLATLFPVLIILGAMAHSTAGRFTRLDSEVRDERALLAAESGVDEAIFRASTITGLVSGVPVTRNLGGGMSFTIRPVFLKTDLQDNDGDSDIDEPDENLFQVLVIGSYLGTTRRLVAYLGPQDPGTSPVGALTTMNQTGTIQVQGTASLDGRDYNIDGTPGLPINDVPGVTIEPPGTVADLYNMTPPGDQSKISGAGGTTPSFGESSTPTNLQAIQLRVQNAANIVLTSNNYNNLQFGNGDLGQFNIIYRNGNVDFRGNTQGAGIMFITGNLDIIGNFRFDGIIYVLGSVNIHGNGVHIYGGLVTGPNCPSFNIQGNDHIYYSQQAISLATAALPTKYMAFNGWQEISRR